MSTIDQRVVEMRFDNRQFEAGVATTMSTLEKFKQSLNLTGASKGLENVGAAAKNCDMSMLSSAVETVKTRFSALEVIGITTLSRITNAAITTSKRMASALTIDPIKTGFAEYETQINAVQTILANTQSKGTTLDDVNGALDTLNQYSDKTIYNFTEMTRNIGTFTAAGIDLDTSVSAIQGIANLAAVSGSTSQQASTAMYQLSQALASGTVKLMDWNSVVNAGMGGQVFQDALKKTSKELGTGAEAAIKANGSFRESLQTGWLTSEVLTETLKKFTTSGATEYVAEYTGLSKEAVQSALDSAKAQYGEAEAIDKAAEALANKSGKSKDEIKQALQLAQTSEDAATKVKTFSQLFDTLKEAAQSGWTQTWEIIVGDFEEAKELLTNISDVIGKVIGDSANARNELLQGWKDAGGRNDLIEGFKNAFDGIVNIIKPIKEAFRDIFPPMTVKNLTDLTKTFKGLTTSFAEFTSSHGPQIKSIFKGIFSVLDIGWTIVKNLASGISDLLGYIFGFSGGFLDAAASVGDWLTNIRNSSKEVDIFGKAVDKIKGFVTGVINKLKEFGTTSKDAFSTDKYEGIVGMLKLIWEIVYKIGAVVGKVFVELGKGLTEAFSGIDFNQLISAINGGLITGILLTIKNFTKGIFEAFNGEGGVLANITGILDDVRGCFQAYQDQLKAGTLLKIASAIGILAASILVISTIDGADLNASLGAITVLFAELMGSLAIFTQISGNMNGVMKGTTVMIGMSIAIGLLAGALKKISTIDPVGVIKGLVGIAGLMAEVSIFLQTAKFDGNMMGAATSIILIATAMHILAGAVKKFSKMDWGEIGRGLAAMAGALASVALALNMLPVNTKSIGVGMIAISAAMVILSKAMSDFGGMNWEEIIKGLVGMAGALAIITEAMWALPTDILGDSIALIAISAALIVLSKAMTSFGGMTWDELAIGLISMGGALGILAVALNLMNGTLAGSAALVIAAGALAIIAPVMKSLGEMSLSEIGTALLTMAAAFGAVGLAGALLTPVIPSILGLAAAMALFGISILGIGAGLGLIGIGLSAIATGFTALSVALGAGATAIVASLTIIVTGLINLIPAVCVQIAQGIIAFAQTIATGAPVIAQAIGTVLNELLNMIVTYIPKIVTTGMLLLIGLLSGIANNIQQVVETAVLVIINFVNGIANSLGMIIQAGVNLIISFINGMAESIRNNTYAMIEATNNLMDAVMEAIGAYFSNFTSRGKELSGKIISGIKSKLSDFKSAAKDMMNGFIQGIKSKFTEIKNAAVNVIEGAVDGVKSFLGIASPSKLFAEIGGYSMKGYAEGMSDDTTAEEAAKEKAKDVVETFNDTLDSLTLDKKTLELEYELAIANGETVDESAKLSKEMDIQSKRVQIANAEYENTMREFGATAEETQTAYNKLLEEKIAMSELSAKLSEIQQQEFEKNRSAIDDYINWMEKSEKLLKMGLSASDIDTAARKATGYTGSVYFDFSKISSDTKKESTEVGKAVSSGVAEGIANSKSVVKKAAINIAGTALGATKGALKINSPSKAFAQIGKWSVEGLADGLSRYSTIVSGAADGVADTALNSVAKAMSGISSAFDDSVDVQPTIRPVLDMTNIQNGANSLSSMFGRQQVALSGINVGYTDHLQALANSMQFSGNSNDDVVEAIAELRSDFGSLINAINNMQIRMDSGTVVGEIIGKIDNGLGQIANHKGRGN